VSRDGLSPLLWERWDEVDRLLMAALDLPVEQRAGFVHAEVPEAGPFRDLVVRLVERLATGHDRVTAPQESVVRAAFGEAGPSPGDLEPGQTVGRYVVVRRRARGGMATVYEAERSDGAYRQRVALKILRRGLDTDDLIRRFLTERQILSSLSHPNIARLLDGGSTPDGRPFLVMELVNGQPVTRYADESRLDVSGRLRLFLGVADAVHAAHRQLVIHRDIKPSNILVDHDGRVKLLDFGIAKLMASETEHTQADARALTPEYASPEQLRGDPVTTASDVYQLGLLLRELLTGLLRLGTDTQPGEPPLRMSRLAPRGVGTSPSAAARAAARSTTPAGLARRLRGDLDLIVAKALRPEAESRYASADELAADVRRHLRGLPILAHQESVGYRSRKFVARHAWAVGAGSAAIVLLAGYALTVTVQSRRIAAERDRAELEARKASQVTDFLVDLFHSADPNQAGGDDITARDLLEQGARRLDEEEVQDPAVRAAMLGAIGRSYQQLGLYREARFHMELAVEAHRTAGPVTDALAGDLATLAHLVNMTDRPAAHALYEEAVATAERSGGPHNPRLGVILSNYSAALAHTHPDDARPGEMQIRALQILRAAPGDLRKELAQALLISSYGKPPEVGIPRMQEALAILRSLHGDRHSAVAGALSDLALATERVDPLAADSLMQEALGVKILIYGRRHALLLGTLNNLAALRRDRGDFAGAEPLYREVLALRTELYPEHQVPQAYTHYGLGLVLTETGQPREGEAHLRNALAILEREMPHAHPLVSLTRAALGNALSRQGRFREAEVLLIRALPRILDGPLNSSEKTRALRWMVTLYDRWGQPGKGEIYRQHLDSLMANTDLVPAESGGR
jgi:serine/threonine-protein kinase